MGASKDRGDKSGRSGPKKQPAPKPDRQAGPRMGENQERRGKDRRSGAPGQPPPGTVVDRRLGLDRRRREQLLSGEDLTALERRRGPGRRLSEFTKSAEEGEMTTEQFLFLMAVEAFKKANNRMFPTWTDVLEVIRLLGYRKTMPSELNLTSAEDWHEPADAPSNVRPERWAERFAESTGFGARGGKSEREMTDDAIAEFEAQFETQFDDEPDDEDVGEAA